MPRQETIRASSPEEVIIPPQINQQVEDQNVPVIGIEPSPFNIEVRTQRDGIGTNLERIIYQVLNHLRNVILPISVGKSTPSSNVNTESENNSTDFKRLPCKNSRNRFVRKFQLYYQWKD